MTAHTCESCGLLHDAMTAPGEPVEVILARIAADQAVQVERIRAGAVRAEAAAEVEVARELGAADVDAAEAEAELLGAAIEAAGPGDEAPEPIEMIAPELGPGDGLEDQGDEEAPPPADDQHQPRPPAKKRGLGLW